MKKPKFIYTFQFVSLLEPDLTKEGLLIAKNDLDFDKRYSELFNGTIFIKVTDKIIYNETSNK